jgi:hypothetical protein
MLTDTGALLLEVADIGSLRFVPSTAESDLWRPWWFALGRSRGASFDVVERIEDLLVDGGFTIERRDRCVPVSSSREAKLVHTLGFEQCVPAYLTEVGAPPDQIEIHRKYLRQVIDDPSVTVELFSNTQYIARRRTLRE